NGRSRRAARSRNRACRRSVWPRPARSCGAGLEPGLQGGFVQIAADEDGAAPAAFLLAPGLLKVAFEDHVYGLEDQAAVLALNVDDALGAQDVLALLAQQAVQPGGEFGAVQRTVQRQGDALDVVVVGMAGRAVPMIVVIVMTAMLVVDMVLGMVMPVAAMFVVDVALGAVGRVHEVRLDLED